jgi:hypothetical protein
MRLGVASRLEPRCPKAYMSRSMSTFLHSRIQRVQESFFKPVRTNDCRPCLFAQKKHGAFPHKSQPPYARQVHRVVIDVPATTANLGPGFDSFGFALDVWNRVIVERADEFSMTITGEGADRIKCSEDNMIVKAASKALESLGLEMPPLRFECQNAVTLSRTAPVLVF